MQCYTIVSFLILFQSSFFIFFFFFRRGILQKTIDCLRDIYDRCSNNITQKQELDMLFSIEEWKQGQELLCEDLNRKLGKGSHCDFHIPQPFDVVYLHKAF